MGDEEALYDFSARTTCCGGRARGARLTLAPREGRHAVRAGKTSVALTAGTSVSVTSHDTARSCSWSWCAAWPHAHACRRAVRPTRLLPRAAASRPAQDSHPGIKE